VDLLADVHERVFGTDSSRLRRSVLAQLRDRPETVAMVVAMAGAAVTCTSTLPRIASRSWPVSGSAASPLPLPMSGIPAASRSSRRNSARRLAGRERRRHALGEMPVQARRGTDR
jgi:hypothetical protein